MDIVGYIKKTDLNVPSFNAGIDTEIYATVSRSLTKIHPKYKQA